MANPTSNFGWQMPTSTDLVTDLPADFEVFGQAVDTTLVDLKGGTTGQVLKKNTNTDMDFVWAADSAGMTNPMTTTGDTIYSSSGSTPARLGIGSTGNVLTVAGGLPTWAAPPGTPATSYALINTGGTALTGASTITVSGLSGYNKFMVLITDASSANASSDFSWRINTDSGATVYKYAQGPAINNSATYSTSSLGAGYTEGDQIYFAKLSTSSSSNVNGGLLIDGGNSSGIKILQSLASGTHTGGSGNQAQIISGVYTGTSVVSSISVLSTSGNFDNGTLFVYGG